MIFINILSIGNSFSQDATRYLHYVAKRGGDTLNTVNLYIGGCSLERHYRNMLSEEKAYSMEFNGQSTGFFVSVKEALLSRKWDVITLQQVSSQSNDYSTYQPYLDSLSDYVRRMQPAAKLAVHQTWAYEDGSTRLCEELGYSTQREMYLDVKKAYDCAASDINADILIPSGEAFQKLIDAGIEKIHRDTFHASFGIGRFALGLLWYRVLCGKNVSENTFSDFDEMIEEETVELIKKCINEIKI